MVGGIIPPEDAATLRRRGVAAVFTPKDYQLTAMMDEIVTLVRARNCHLDTPRGYSGDMNDHAMHQDAPTGRALTRQAISATLHCLTGCAIGEVLGVVIGTALGLGERGHDRAGDRARLHLRLPFTIAPVLRAGLGLGRRAGGVALAADTVSITVMEIVDNVVLLADPRARWTLG